MTRDRKLIESYTLYKHSSVWVLSWLVPKWFDELTNHIGVNKTRSFYSISSFTTCLYAKNLSYMHTFAWLKQQYHRINNMLIRPANRTKRTWFTKVARVIYVTSPMVRLRPAGIKQKSPIQKKRLCLFITMKKSKSQYQQNPSIHWQPKKKKCSGKKRSKKQSIRKTKEKDKNKNKRFRWKKNDSRQFFLIFKRKFSPIAIGERNNSLTNMVT